MTESITHTIDIFAIFVGLTGAGIIITGVVRCLRDFIAQEIGVKGKFYTHDMIRYRLGVYLLLGLEFLVAADILETVFKPSLEQLIILGSIVIIRTVLNYFLDHELAHIKGEIK